MVKSSGLDGSALRMQVERGAKPALALDTPFGFRNQAWSVQLPALLGSATFFQAFVVFEAAVFLTSLLAIFRIPIPRGVIWSQFVVHLLVTCGVLYLMLTFKMTRLF